MASQPPAPATADARGRALGLPARGAGSLTSSGPRLLALIVDCIASGLIAALFVSVGSDGRGVAGHLPGNWSLVPLAVDYLLGLAVSGQTLGMHLTGVRLVAVDRAQRPSRVRPVQIVVRTVLLFLLVPALIFDRDGRGLHDRISGTALVRT